MFDFLKTQHTMIQEDETGTYADALLQMREAQTDQTTIREYGHEAHLRDYGDQREVARNSLGFA
ncbi:hypothetical protein G6L37_29860 [Agrobacterium rubi]|uniref:hypothetical protein n=1 Tax=Agrobacterium rubi TaxID=28099 RepID=UPI001574CFE2|nr:hypothetical protein [Agrobacterium rubi]MCL6654960.1 hypothetical protein [Agrobacterium rubi]NTF09712.1 hypothetical protein [Agrobacterium rubi]NTF22619.1 hypothetical protein [Agrobacterium rubi]NTF29476.1 hypothetical protein [Agrobacterium rubi]